MASKPVLRTPAEVTAAARESQGKVADSRQGLETTAENQLVKTHTKVPI